LENVPKYMNDNVIVLERFVNDLFKNIKKPNIIDFTLELQSLKDLHNVFTKNFQWNPILNVLSIFMKMDEFNKNGYMTLL
jgi:hypothetical protein